MRDLRSLPAPLRRAAAPVAAISLAMLLGCPPPNAAPPPYHEYMAVSAGFAHSCALTRNGAAFCWGLNTTGQLGDGTTNDSPKPVAVSGGHVFSSISAGGYHSCGVSQGAVLCWGNNLNGQLGQGAAPGGQSHIPTAVVTPAGETFASVTLGGSYSCALTTTGKAYCWGQTVGGALGTNGPVGKLGDPNDPSESLTTPTAVEGGLTFKQLAASRGGWHSCGYATGGAIYCWGTDLQHQVQATGTDICTTGGNWKCSMVPTQIAVPTSNGVTAGGDFSCAVDANVGKMKCWGASALHQLGPNETALCHYANNTQSACAPTPIDVAPPANQTFVEVAAGDEWYCSSVYPVGNSVVCAGDNRHGQLGDGTTTSRTLPAPLSVPLGALSVSSGWGHTCVVTDGYLTAPYLLYCWGENTSGQIGTGTTGGDVLTPTRVVEP